ncbi:MAG TPA: beta-ketoacyl-ACP synthase 3 [Fibrobacteraceae bacterium]|nr:beta-ketoacyl-ACP synthase 3 [Fibrobacteraceae bacterium]
MKKVGIKSIGSYVPAKILDNAQLSKMVDTSDEWIVSRTGIRERRIAESESTADMGVLAVQSCVSEQERESIELLITACGTQSNVYPTQSAQIAHRTPLPHAVVLDLNVACTGLIAGMILAQGQLETGRCKNAVVAATEKMSSFVDYTDRSNCILFGDGAAAVQLSTEDYLHEIIATEIGSDPSGAELLTMGDRSGPGYFWQDGKNIYRFVQNTLPKLILNLKEKAGIGDGPYWLVPHQANARMFDTIAAKVHLPIDRVLLTIDKYANTSSSSVGIALDEFDRSGKIKKGDLVMMTAFGAGLAWAGAVVRW